MKGTGGNSGGGNTGDRWFAPKYPNDYTKLAEWWSSTAGNSKIKADNKETKGIAPAAIRNTPYTNATLNNTSGGGDSLQKYLPYIVGGGVALMLVMMMLTTM